MMRNDHGREAELNHVPSHFRDNATGSFAKWRQSSSIPRRSGGRLVSQSIYFWAAP